MHETLIIKAVVNEILKSKCVFWALIPFYLTAWSYWRKSKDKEVTKSFYFYSQFQSWKTIMTKSRSRSRSKSRDRVRRSKHKRRSRSRSRSRKNEKHRMPSSRKDSSETKYRLTQLQYLKKDRISLFSVWNVSLGRGQDHRPLPTVILMLVPGD